MNNSGRALTIFLSALLIVFISAFCISVFYLQKETENTQNLQEQVVALQQQESQLKSKLTDTEQQVFILEEKNKEADERINSLLDDLELEEGLRNEVKNENATLKEALAAEAKIKADLKEKLTAELDTVKKSFATAQKDLVSAQERAQKFEDEVAAIKREKDELEDIVVRLRSTDPVLQDATQDESLNSEDGQSQLNVIPQDIGTMAMPAPLPDTDTAVAGSTLENVDSQEFGRIVVNSEKEVEGRVLSVDNKTDFMIFNLGVTDGIRAGDMMSIFRGNQYLGDVKVSRVQSQMAAADFIPPFSSTRVRKNDQVKFKVFE